MSSITPIYSRSFLGGYYYRSSGGTPVWLQCSAGAALVVLPLFLFSVLVGNFQLFELYISAALFGVVLGREWFTQPPAEGESCVPAGRVPGKPSGANAADLKKAA